MPVVAECDDGELNDSRTVQVDHIDVAAAIDGARGADGGAPSLGVVGSGTGMICFDLKGGIGSASRVVRPHDREGDPATGSRDYVVGVLAMTNFGWLDRLTIDGVPVGRTLHAEGWPATGGGTVADAERRHEPEPRTGELRRSSWRPMRRCCRNSCRASPGAPAWAWPGRAPPPATAPARSSWRSRPATASSAVRSMRS